MNLVSTLRKDNQKGMTLIELLGVIVIIGILFVVLNAAINSSTDAAKLAGVKTDFRSLQMGFEQQVRETSKLPITEDGNFDYNAISDFWDMEFTNGVSDGSNPFGGKYEVSVVSDVSAHVDGAPEKEGIEIAATNAGDNVALYVWLGNNGNPEFATTGLGNDLKTTN